MSELSSFLFLIAKEVAGGEVLKFVIPDKKLSLGAFATAGSPEEEEDMRFGEEAVRMGLVLGIG